MDKVIIPPKYIKDFIKNYPSIPKATIDYMVKIKYMREFYEKKKIDELRQICEAKGIYIKNKSGRFKNSKDLIDNLILYLQDKEDFLRSQTFYRRCSINFELHSLDLLKKLCDKNNISYSNKITKNEMVKKLEKLISN